MVHPTFLGHRESEVRDEKRFAGSESDSLQRVWQRWILGDEDEDAATFGGTLTGQLGRIPESGEKVDLGNLWVKIEDADETRVIATTVRLKEPSEETVSKDS